MDKSINTYELHWRREKRIKKHLQSKKTTHHSGFNEIVNKIAGKELAKLHSRMDKNFGLSEKDFQQIVAELQNNNEQLFKKIFFNHFKDCQRFIVRQYNASPADAYDVTMETLLIFYKKMKAQKIVYGNLRFLFTQIAGRTYLRWKNKKRREGPMPSLESIDYTEEIEINDNVLIALENAWMHLCKNCQHLLNQFYREELSLKRIAELSNKSAVAIRKQKQRCVEKLRMHFKF